MRRLLALAVPSALLLTLPATAPGKGVMSAKVCGADGCRTIDRVDEALLGGGPPTAGPKRGEPFVRLDLRVGVPGHTELVRMLYLPRSELVLASDGETWMVPAALAQLRATSGRVTPFAASELPASAPLGGGAQGADGALAPETRGAAEPAAGTDGGGTGTWWLALPGAALVLGGAVVLARRARRGQPGAAAGAART